MASRMPLIFTLTASDDCNSRLEKWGSTTTHLVHIQRTGNVCLDVLVRPGDARLARRIGVREQHERVDYGNGCREGRSAIGSLVVHCHEVLVGIL